MVRDPARCAVFGFAATEYATVPLPLPVVPAMIVRHGAPLVADQAQPSTAETPTVPVVAALATDTLVGDTEELHGEENENVFDSALRPTPAGPTAATRAS